MSEWDFLWDLSGQELTDAMSTGGTSDDWDYVEGSLKEKENKKRKAEREELKLLRDSGQISKDNFIKRKTNLFSHD